MPSLLKVLAKALATTLGTVLVWAWLGAGGLVPRPSFAQDLPPEIAPVNSPEAKSGSAPAPALVPAAAPATADEEEEEGEPEEATPDLLEPMSSEKSEEKSGEGASEKPLNDAISEVPRARKARGAQGAKKTAGSKKKKAKPGGKTVKKKKVSRPGRPGKREEGSGRDDEAAVGLPQDFSYVAPKLRKAGMRWTFIRKLQDAAGEPELDRIVKPNVFGFSIAPDYSGHVTETAVQKCRDFIFENQRTFSKAEKRYGVSQEVISSLLWVETKLGQNMGSYPVVKVFMNLALADHPAVRKASFQQLREEIGTRDRHYRTYAAKLKDSSTRKAKWAIDQLKALHKMQQKHEIDIFALKGSYAGAFGMAQFIPDSFIRWAKAEKGSTPDLAQPADAILSVGHYLQKHGWKLKKKPSWKKALYAYNRSDDYGQTILKLSELVKVSAGGRKLSAE